MKWIAITQKKPATMQRVLCVLNDKTKIMLTIAPNGTWKTMDNTPLPPLLYPTHWMLLEWLPLPDQECYENCTLCKTRHSRGHMTKYMHKKTNGML